MASYTYPKNKDCLSPQMYFLYVLKKCYTAFGYTPRGKIFNDVRFKKALLYNNFTLDHKEKIFYVTAERNTPSTTYTGETTLIWPTEIEDEDNCYDPTNGKYTAKERGFLKFTIDINVENQSSDPSQNWQASVTIYKDGAYVGSVYFKIYDTNAAVNIKATKRIFVDEDLGDIHLEIQCDDDESFPSSFKFLSGNLTVEAVSSSNLNRYAKEIAYANHVPQKKISVFLEAVYRTFGIIPFFNHKLKTVNLVYLKDLVNTVKQTSFKDRIIKNSLETVAQNDYQGVKFSFDTSQNDDYLSDANKDYSKYEHLGDYNTIFDRPEAPGTINKTARILNSNKITLYSVYEEDVEGTMVENTRWNYFTDDFKDYILGEGKKHFQSGFFPMTMAFTHDFGDVEITPPVDGSYDHPYWWMMPRVSQMGSSPAFETGINDPGLRLMIFYGIQPVALADGNETPYTYPFASFRPMNAAGGIISGESLQLTWQGQEGLIAEFWQPVIDWLQRRIPVELLRQLTVEELFNLVLDRKFMLNNNVLALFKEVSIPVSSKQIGKSKLIGYTS